jgi:hypothetical protein
MKSEIRQAEHDLQEMKDIYEEANKTLTVMRKAYMDMPPDPLPQEPQQPAPEPQATTPEPKATTPEPLTKAEAIRRYVDPNYATNYERWKALSE